MERRGVMILMRRRMTQKEMKRRGRLKVFHITGEKGGCSSTSRRT